MTRPLFSCLALVFAGLFAVTVHAKPLTLEVFNPGTDGLFPVTSVIISGEKHVILVDAQMEKRHAQTLVKKIRESGKTLDAIYISHSDPDFYFGADVIMKAFPNAKLWATSATIANIASNYKSKEAYWGPILKDQKPDQIILPKPFTGRIIKLEGHAIHIEDVNEPDPNRTWLWIPSLETALGGITLTANSHLWVADSPSVESRNQWLRILENIRRHEPKVVIPSHFLLNEDGSIPDSPDIIDFNRDYLVALDEENKRTETAAELIEAMKKRFKNLAGVETLEFSAKVLKGEETWPKE